MQQRPPGRRRLHEREIRPGSRRVRAAASRPAGDGCTNARSTRVASRSCTNCRATRRERTNANRRARGSRRGWLGRVAADAVSPRARHRSPGHLADPWLRHGRPAAGQQRAPGHGDGARPARQRPVQPGAQARPGGPRLARPRPVRALQRPRLDPPVLDALPVGLRPRAGRHRGLPPVRLAHARATPRPATRRASRSRPGRSARGSATPSGWPSPSASCASGSAPTCRPPHLRHRRRRLLHGGRQPRSGVARRPPRPRPPDLRVRRQPGDDRRHDRAVELRRRRAALRGLRLERRVPRRDRRRLRRPRGRPARGPCRRHAPVAARAAIAHRHARRPTTPTTRPPTATRSPPRTSRAPRRSWASRTSRSGRRNDLVTTYREAVAERSRRPRPAGRRPSTPSTATSGRPGTRPGTAPARRAGRTPCRRSSRARRRPPARRWRRSSARSSTTSPASCPAPPT